MKREMISKTAASGVVALIFLVLGFQIAVVTGNVFNFRAQREKQPKQDTAQTDTSAALSMQNNVDLAYESYKADSSRLVKAGQGMSADARHNAIAALARHDTATRTFTDSRTVLEERYRKPRVQTFDFNPNTISEDSLVLLGLSPKQAAVIGRYREKGGRFRTKEDFARAYVVDSLFFARVEPHIKIPRLNLNTADSVALLTLRGIGPYYASKILEYRTNLGGSFVSAEQLMEIEGIDIERYEGLRDAVEVIGTPTRFDIWHADSAALSRHPYIGPYATLGVIRYRMVTDSTRWSIEDLHSAGVFSDDNYLTLRQYIYTKE